MKKRYLFLILTIVLSALMALACTYEDEQKPVFTPDPYLGYDGVDPNATVEVDDYITLDGTLNEDIWMGNKTVLNIAGATTDQVTGTAVDKTLYGDRSARVMSFVGEKAIYFGIDALDKNLYYNGERAQTHNTGVEIFVAKSNQSGFIKGCYSIRINPTGKGKGYFYRMYEPRYDDGVLGKLDTGNDSNYWTLKTDDRGLVSVAIKTNGTVMNSASQTDYDSKNNVGYVVEVAVDKSLIGGEDATDFIYTVSYFQARNFTENRIGSSIVSGTKANDPSTWLLATSDGFVSDKKAYFDKKTMADENVTIDGVLDDGLWSNAVGRTIVTNVLRAQNANEKEKLRYTTYAVTTGKGVYVGIECNDANAYFHGSDGSINYNTGAEVMITVGGETTINPAKTKQIRVNVGGATKRYNGKWSRKDEYAYLEAPYGALIASKVKGEINTSTTDGWTSEIFLPWDSFAVDLIDNFDDIAIVTNIYRATADRNSCNYLTALSNGRNYSRQANPQKHWMLFNGGKPVYDGVKVNDILFEPNDLTNGKYEIIVTANYFDDFVSNSKFSEIFVPATNGSFDFNGNDCVTVTDNGDGTYLISINKDKATAFETIQPVTFTCGEKQTQLFACIEDEIVVDGVLNDGAWAQVNSLKTTQSNGGFTSTNDLKIALRESAMFISAKITDENFDAFRDKLPLGLEMYISVDGSIESGKTFQLRIASNSALPILYDYIDNGSTYPWGNITYPYGEIIFASDNNGSYAIEAKIPYSAFGLEEKPQSLEIYPLTSFVRKTTDNGAKSVRLDKFEGGNYTYDKRFYHTFDSSGYAPTRTLTLDKDGKQIDKVNMYAVLDEADGYYSGEVTMSLYPDTVFPVLDASFGEYDAYFENLGGGKYAYALPKTLMEEKKEIVVTVTSSAYSLNSKLLFKMIELDGFVFSVETHNIYNLALNDENYEFDLTVTADDDGKYPIDGLTFSNNCQVTAKGKGVYAVKMEKSLVESKQKHDLTVKITMLGREISDTITMHYAPWNDEETAKIRSYLNFDGTIDDMKGGNTYLGTGSTANFVDGTDGQGIQLQNPDKESPKAPKRNVNVSQPLGTSDFTISFDLKLDPTAIGSFNTAAQYELLSSGGAVDSGSDTVQISAYDNKKASIGFRIQLGKTGGATHYYYDNLKLPVDEWFNFALEVDRNYTGTTETVEKVNAKVYINGVLKANNLVSINLVDGKLQTLGNGNIALGGDYWLYDGGSRKLQMDNFMLYDGFFTTAQLEYLGNRVK